MSASDLCAGLRAEAEILRALVERPDVEGDAVTPFAGWRVRDVIGHLVTLNRLAVFSMTDEPAFTAGQGAFGAGVSANRFEGPDAQFRAIAAYEDSQLRHLDWKGLLAAWNEGQQRLLDTAAPLDAETKVKWFGPPMSLGTLIKARQMEMFGYGQDVFDLYRVQRQVTDGVRNVADFAIRTFGFSFANRGLKPPERPFVSLTAPSGAVWTWNDPSAAERVEGPARDFCLIATQRRNVADTDIKTKGEGAAHWMKIAQCIAGAPVDSPAPGLRAWERAANR